MYRTLLLVAIMLVSTAAVGVGTVAASHSGSTVYVDASNTGTEDGSQANPFNTIQEGVGHASPGDTVLVTAGTYHGTVMITKPLAVRADGDVTLLGGTRYGFYLTANGVTVDGFTIERSATGVYSAHSRRHQTITGNTIIDSGMYGIFLDRGHDSTISDNTISNAGRDGIHLRVTQRATVDGNTITGGDTSLWMYWSPDNTIEDNTFRDARRYGIHLINANRNTLTGNVIRDARHFGIRVAGARYNLLSDNVFANARNVYPTSYNRLNNWHVTPRSGPNVIGGPAIGGNYWSNPAGTGFGDTAPDANEDGFADSHYTASDVTDEHPLVPDRGDPPAVDASPGVSTYEAGDAPVVVDPDVTATDSDGGAIDGARVVVQNAQPGDTLGFTAQHGIAGSYDSSSGVLTLTGSATAAEFQDVFRSVTFSNALATPESVDRRITFALGANLPNDGTGHFYEYVDAGGITWHDANQAASARSYFGLRGYLVTVTSQAENDFVAEKLQGNGWIGASDDTAFSFISKDANGHDQWYWVTGPEQGTHFWTGDLGEGFSQPVPGQYANWARNEPNDYFGQESENYAHFYHNSANWNDFPNAQGVDGYVVEYGGLASDPTLSLQDTKTVAVRVNSPPSISVDAPAVTVDEGSTATNGGAVSDDGGAVNLTASIGTVQDNGDGTWSWFAGTSDGPDDSQSVTVTAEDSHGETASVSFDLTVENVAPSVNADSASVTVDEGQTASNTGTFADPGADVVTLTASVGTVVDNGDGTWSWSAGTSDGPDDSQTVTVTATDNDGAVSTTSFDLTVENVDPSVTASVSLATIDEGSTTTITASFTDPGADTHDATIDWGDGSPVESAMISAGSVSGAHTYADDGSYAVTVTVTDDDGGAATETLSVVVENVAPNVTASASPTTIDEGASTTLSASFTDPGVEDTHTVTVDWGDGATESVTPSDGALSTSHTYADDGQYTAIVTVTDDDGGIGTAAATVDVANVAPVLSADVNDSSVAGSPVSASGSFADVGIQDTHSIEIDWGDGTTSSAPVTQGAGSGSFADSHVYATGGYYDVAVTVTDDDGGSDEYTETITVAHLATVDVKPDSAENTVNSRANGVLPVAILATGNFDVADVDVSSLRLSATEGGSGAAPAHGGHLEDVDGDGDLDLLVHFENADIGLASDSTSVFLSGEMIDGIPLVGSDSVRSVGEDSRKGGNGKSNGRGR